MKKMLFVYLMLMTLQAFAQSSRDCEDLVFNTRELNAFAYNTRCKTEAYPFISRDGNKMYYTNNQTKDWLFFTRRDETSKVWSVPVPLSIDNFSAPIRSSYLDESRMELYFTTETDGGHLYKCASVEGSWTHFSKPEKIELLNSDNNNNRPFSALSFANDMQEMYAYIGRNTLADDETSKSMGRFVKSGDLSYTFTGFISGTKEEMGMLCKNGLAYIFTNDVNVNLLFCRTRKSLSEDFGPTVYLLKEFEKQLDINQVRYADSSGEMVLVLSESVWEKNEIYFLNSQLPENWEARVFSEEELRQAHLFTETEDKPSMVYESPASRKIESYEITGKSGDDIVRLELGQPFPNPTDAQFFIYYKISGKAEAGAKPAQLQLINNSGQTVHSQVLEDACGEARVQTSGLKSGIYYIRIDYNGVYSPSVKVTFSL